MKIGVPFLTTCTYALTSQMSGVVFDISLLGMNYVLEDYQILLMNKREYNGLRIHSFALKIEILEKWKYSYLWDNLMGVVREIIIMDKQLSSHSVKSFIQLYLQCCILLFQQEIVRGYLLFLNVLMRSK
jgi:hypothetical protein